MENILARELADHNCNNAIDLLKTPDYSQHVSNGREFFNREHPGVSKIFYKENIINLISKSNIGRPKISKEVKEKKTNLFKMLYDQGISVKGISDQVDLTPITIRKYLPKNYTQENKNNGFPTDSQKEMIIEAYEHSKVRGFIDLASKHLGFRTPIISACWKEAGLIKERKSRLSNKEINQICRYYSKGRTMEFITGKFKCSKVTVYNHLNKKKITLKK